jgi:hypothetical protein
MRKNSTAFEIVIIAVQHEAHETRQRAPIMKASRMTRDSNKQGRSVEGQILLTDDPDSIQSMCQQPQNERTK